MNITFHRVSVLAVCALVGCVVPVRAQAQPQRLNLAKWQNAAADSAAGGGAAFLATDGTVGSANAWTSSGAGPHWLTITLPVVLPLGSAQLFLGNDDAFPVSNFSLQYFTNNGWVNIPGASFSGNTATALNVVFNSPVTTSLVRFYTTDATAIVREIALFGTNDPAGYPLGSDVTLNLCKQCSVIASSSSGTNYASRAVDGYAGTNSGWQSANVNGPHTLEVDFPAASRIGSAHLYSGSGTSAAIASFTLNYWNGSAWVAIPGATVSANTQKELVVSFTSPVSTSKVQLSIPGSGAQFVRELAVFAAAAGTSGYPLWTDVVSNDPPATQWETFGDGFWNLVNGANSNALVTSITGATQAPTNAADITQQFQVLYNYDSDSFRLRHRSTWQCLAAQSASILPGTAVVEEAGYFGMPHELWRLQSLGGGSYRIVNVWNGLALQTDNQTPATVTLATPSSDTRQQWQLAFRAIYPKKGSAGQESSWARFGASWNYNWGRDATVAAPGQVVYLPQQWNGGGIGSLPQYFSAWHSNPKPMALLGFNEPDQSGQANMTVTNAFSLWPQMLAGNVPLVGPATSWPLTSWMSNFWSLATNAGYRVDESGFHWYSYPSADTIMGNLQSVYNAWGRPIWITEFGVGFSSGTWTEEMNYNFLAEFLWRAEGLACLHRYGVFCFTQDPPANPYDQTSPQSDIYKSDGVTFTALGELYAAWDADLVIHTNTRYILHNKGSYYRIANNGGAAPALANIRTNNPSVQWQLVPAPTLNRCYLVSMPDARRLNWDGSALSLAASGTTGSAVEWTYTADANGYFFIDHPGTSKRLCLNRANDGTGKPTSTNLTMVAAGTVNDNTRWRFIKPYQAIPLNLAAVPGNGQAALSWTPVAGATGYNLKRSVVSGGPYAVISSGGVATNYTDSGLENNRLYYYVASTLSAAGESANSPEVMVIPGGAAINSGGGVIGWFGSDTNFSGGSTSSTTSGIELSGLVSPAPSTVYQADRYGNFSYTISGLSPGAIYWLRLHFAETYWTASGKRVFSVSVNGSTVLPSFDIFAAAGAQNKAVIREFYVAANGSGQMVLQFSTIADNAKVNGIELLQTKPLVPAGLWAAAGAGQVALSWSAAAGATSYNVYRAAASGGPYVQISAPGSVTTTCFVDSTPISGVMNYYVLTAQNSYALSGYCPEAGALVPCATPATPAASNNGPIFAGMTLNLTASTVPSASYSWTGPNGFSSSAQNPTLNNASTNASGVYSVTATVGACTSLPGTTTVAVNPPALVSVQPAQNGFALVWPGGTLQSATNLSGPWTNITAATNPYSITPTGAQQYFRIKLQ